MKIMLILCGTSSKAPLDETQAAPPGDLLRSRLILDTLAATIVDHATIADATGWRSVLYRYLPSPWAIACEGFRRRREADVLVTWSEQVTIGLGFLQWLRRDRTPHVAMLYWLSKPQIKAPLKLFGRRLARLVMWNSVQARFAVRELGVAPGRIAMVGHFVDELFWRPQPQIAIEPDFICAVGREMRDYPTLIAALKGAPVRCHIASSEIRLRAGQQLKAYALEELAQHLPPNVSLGPLPIFELRKLYARAALVVVPIQPSDTDNGITVILEAMAMGKTVICSKTEGQVDVIEDGVTGFYVEPENPPALTKLIERLLADPATRKQVGERARAFVLKHHRLQQFADGTKQAVVQAYQESVKRSR